MSQKLPLSVVINTKNSENTLEAALKSVEDFATEIIVVDMMSVDKTVQLAKKFTSHVFQASQDWDYVEPARNQALRKVSQPWVLILDADEEIPALLMKKVAALISEENADVTAYFLPRKNEIFGKFMTGTGWWPDYQLRLFKRGSVQWSDQIHSTPDVDGKTAYLEESAELAIVHHNFQHVSQFIDRLNRYTTIEASKKSKANVKESDVIGEFHSEFLRRLFQENGIDEGVHGVGLSVLQSTYRLVSTLKVWENSDFPVNKPDQASTIAELRKFQLELNYWIADWQVNNSRGLDQIAWKIRRKFRF